MAGQWARSGIKCGLLLILGMAANPYTHLNLRAQRNATPEATNAGWSEEELQRFAALNPIDSHTHIYQYDPAYVTMLEKLHMHTLDIMVVSDNGEAERKDLTKESADVFDLVRKSNHRVFACTTFDAYRINGPGFAVNAIAGINRAFDEGAVAVKLWKNVGMEIKNGRGNYILPDNPALTPIYRDIAAHHKTLVMHIADPNTAWLPPDSSAPDSQYYLEHPEWYMYRIPAAPSKEQILAARDHVLMANPKLRVVGAHLGSMEADFPHLAADLDRYPNFAVDLTARMPYIMKVPRTEAIAFFTKYQDRLIYGTDDSFYPGADVNSLVRDAENTYARDWRFLSSGARMSLRGMDTQGLALPESILRKVYHDNAVRWFPGMQ